MADANKQVLLIDDNEDIGNMVKIMLQMKGYGVSIKKDAVDVEDHIKNLSPGLVIMDMLLSGADGSEICKKLKANAAVASIPVLMISAHPDAKAQCLNSGADFFIEKPFDMENLLSVVNTAFQENS